MSRLKYLRDRSFVEVVVDGWYYRVYYDSSFSLLSVFFGRAEVDFIVETAFCVPASWLEKTNLLLWNGLCAAVAKKESLITEELVA